MYEERSYAGRKFRRQIRNLIWLGITLTGLIIAGLYFMKGCSFWAKTMDNELEQRMW